MSKEDVRAKIEAMKAQIKQDMQEMTKSVRETLELKVATVMDPEQDRDRKKNQWILFEHYMEEKGLKLAEIDLSQVRNLLVIGPGEGTDIQFFVDRCPNLETVYGLDKDLGALELANDHFSERGSETPVIKMVDCDFDDSKTDPRKLLPDGQKFDTVVGFLSAIHMKRIRELVSFIADVMESDAHLWFKDVNVESVNSAFKNENYQKLMAMISKVLGVVGTPQIVNVLDEILREEGSHFINVQQHIEEYAMGFKTEGERAMFDVVSGPLLTALEPMSKINQVSRAEILLLYHQMIEQLKLENQTGLYQFTHTSAQRKPRQN